MTMKPIRTHDDLVKAQNRLASLMKDNRDGRHDDEIEVLAAILEQYERANVRILPPTPIAAIRYRMDELNLAPRQLEPFIGSRARVSEVLSGARPLTIGMIRALHDGLRIPYASLLSVGDTDHADLEVSRPTLSKLHSLGFDVQESNVAHFVSELRVQQPALFRRTLTPRASLKTDKTALLFWQAAILKRAALRSLVQFDRGSLTPSFLRKLSHLSMKIDGPALAITALEAIGVQVVLLQSLPGTFLDGAAMLRSDGAPVVALTLRHDKLDTFWFTLLHESSHICLHFDELVGGQTAFFDDLDLNSEDRQEQEADTLARDSLIPPEVLRQVHWSPLSSLDDLTSVCSRARVNMSVVAGRWQRDHHNYRKFSRLIERNTVRPLLTGAT